MTPPPRRGIPTDAEMQRSAVRQFSSGAMLGYSRSTAPTPPGLPSVRVARDPSGAGCIAYGYYRARNIGSYGIAPVNPGVALSMNGSFSGDGDYTTYFAQDVTSTGYIELLQPGWYAIAYQVEVTALSPGDVVLMETTPIGDSQQIFTVGVCGPGRTFATLSGASAPFFIYESECSPSVYTIGVEILGASTTGYVNDAQAQVVRLSGLVFPG